MDIMIPTSLGELIDKITILQIKMEEIEAPQKLKNIVAENDALTKTLHSLRLPEEKLLDFIEQLKAVNKKLWVIEDDIREKEMLKVFDQEFIALARAVYITNDERARIKKEINLDMGSAFVEEKSYKQY